MRELQDQVAYMQLQIAQGEKWTSMLLHDRDLLLSYYQGACLDIDSARRESAGLMQQVQELQQENEGLKNAAAASSTQAKRSSSSAASAHAQVLCEPQHKFVLTTRLSSAQLGNGCLSAVFVKRTISKLKTHANR